MTALRLLWMPLLLSAVIVFVASSLIHMFSPWHKSDYPYFAREDAVLDALRPLDLPAGDYMMPRPRSMEEMRSPEFKAKHARGPVLLMTVMPRGELGMGRQLAQWFLYLLLVGLFSAYVAGRALAPGAAYLQAFRFVGTTAFMGFSLALLQMSIWYRRAWRITVKSVIDGLIYALLMAGTFGWLWPR
jgi:hypothetical protein